MAQGILVVDDHEQIRERVVALLLNEGYFICGQASDGVEAIRLTKELSPEISILDISMPIMDGLQALPKMLSAAPVMKVIILTVHQSDQVRQQVCALGAHSFVTKDTLPDTLLAEVRRLVQDK